MAKSKTGGSRAYIRGRIGSDVYSVGKDGMGKRQQVVRSLAEQVSNPRSQSQMFGRMIMSTVMQAVSAMSPIIDHAFDGAAKGQPSISEFIRRNYGLIKADAIAHPASGNSFELNGYQVKGIQCGAYVVSDGSAVIPAAVDITGGYFSIDLTAAGLTVGGLRTALGLNAEGYLTFVGVSPDTGFFFQRIHVKDSLADSVEISSANVATIFDIEGNVNVTPALASNLITFEFTFSGDGKAYGVIVSDKVDGAWVHNKCTLSVSGLGTNVADVVLPTYPTGTAQFLNGGDL